MKKEKYSKTFILIKNLEKRKIHWYLKLLTLLLITLFFCILQLSVGETTYSLSEVVGTLFGHPSSAYFVINVLRLPRMLAGLFAGFAFGTVGYIFQTMFNNPLANPDVLGVTSGSSFAAVLCILLFGAGQIIISLWAITVALFISIMLFLLSGLKRVSLGKMIIVGIGFQAIFNALISYLMIIGNQQSLPLVLRWLNGSLNGISLSQLPLLFLAIIVLVPIITFYGKHLKQLELGEDVAKSLGVKTNFLKIFLITTTVLLIGVSTSVTGPITFVSFLVGPIINKIMGKNFSNVLPAGFLGSILVLCSDFIGQNAFNYKFPVGVITGLFGAPYLIWILIQMSRKGVL